MDAPEQNTLRTPPATWLRAAAFVGAVVIDIALWPRLVADQNSTLFTVAFVAVPVLLTLVPLLLGLTRHDRVAKVVTWICAGLLTAGSILFGLTVGVYFLVAAIILVIAAIVQTG